MDNSNSRYFPSPQSNRTTRQSSRFFVSKRGVKAAAVLSLAAGLPHAESLASGEPSPKNTKNLSSKRKTVVVSPEAHISASSGEQQATPVKKRKTSKKKKIPVARTKSFGALTANKFPELKDEDITPHTLILGTHPSIASLERQEYYGHPMNAFWWIAGDCLGFRRASGVSPSSGKAYKFTPSLRYDESHIIPYEAQIQLLVSKGFCLWDVVGSCERPGSLDQDIRDEAPNDIRGLCKQFSSIRRIIFANGGTGSQMFVKHFKSWLGSGELKAADHEQSQKAFGRALAKASSDNENERCITLISAISVSPAAARYSYNEKRDFWEQHVYRPGLLDFESDA